MRYRCQSYTLLLLATLVITATMINVGSCKYISTARKTVLFSLPSRSRYFETRHHFLHQNHLRRTSRLLLPSPILRQRLLEVNQSHHLHNSSLKHNPRGNTVLSSLHSRQHGTFARSSPFHVRGLRQMSLLSVYRMIRRKLSQHERRQMINKSSSSSFCGNAKEVTSNCDGDAVDERNEREETQSLLPLMPQFASEDALHRKSTVVGENDSRSMVDNDYKETTSVISDQFRGTTNSKAINPEEKEDCYLEMEKISRESRTKKASHPSPPKLKEQDLTESFTRGSGPGGQKVNKTSNRVMLLHRPTQLRVECQETRSLQQNRKIARKRLQNKLDLFVNGDASRLAVKAEVASGKKAKAKARSRARLRKKMEEKEREAAAATKRAKDEDEFLADKN